MIVSGSATLRVFRVVRGLLHKTIFTKGIEPSGKVPLAISPALPRWNSAFGDVGLTPTRA